MAALALFLFCASRLARRVAVSADSDSLYLASLYRDVFIDRIALSGWRTQPAPSFFPDLPVYFLLRALTASPVAALSAYALTELALGMYFVLHLARLLEVSRRRFALVAGLVSLGLLAYVNSFRDYLYIFFFPSCHASAAWVAVASAALIAHQIKRGALDGRRALGMLLLTALVTASDRVYLLHAGALVVALVFCPVVAPNGRRVLVRNALAVGLGVVLGQQLERAPAGLGINVASAPLKIELSWSRIAAMLRLLRPPESELLAHMMDVTMLALAVGISFWTIARAIRRRERDVLSELRVFLCMAFLTSALCIFCASAFSGLYEDARCARYLQTLFTVPYLVVPIAWALTEAPLVRAGIPVLVATMAIMTGPPTESVRLTEALEDSAFYPAKVKCIDDFAERHGAKFALGGYWDARRTTELSHEGLRVLPVAPNLTWYDWNTNRDWFTRKWPTQHYLLLTHTDAGPMARSKLGSPLESRQCYDDEVWLYLGNKT